MSVTFGFHTFLHQPFFMSYKKIKNIFKKNKETKRQNIAQFLAFFVRLFIYLFFSIKENRRYLITYLDFVSGWRKESQNFMQTYLLFCFRTVSKSKLLL